MGLCLRPASTVRLAKLLFIVRRLAVADKMVVLKIDANQHLEFFGRPRLLETGKKEARGRGLALSGSRGAGGDSMGGFAGLFSAARRVAASYRRASAALGSLFSANPFVVAWGLLRRSAPAGAAAGSGECGEFVVF